MLRRSRVFRTWPALGRAEVSSPWYLGWRTSWGRKERRAVHVGVKHTLPKFLTLIARYLHSRHDTWVCSNHILYHMSSLFAVLDAAFTCQMALKPLSLLEHPVRGWPLHSSVCSSHFVVNRHSFSFPHLPLEKWTTSFIFLVPLGVLVPYCCGFLPSARWTHKNCRSKSNFVISQAYR